MGILSQFPAEFIERYQNIHSGTDLELEYKDSRLDFSPLLNLILFAGRTASGLTSSLNFPSIKDELEKLSSQETVFASRMSVVDKLSQRWTHLFDSQTEVINRLLLPRIEQVPMSLQSVTPCRSLLCKTSSTDSQQENKTPAGLRAALRLTPAEVGAKSKFKPRRSMEQSCRILHKEDHLRSLGKTIHNRPDKRHSYEMGNSPFKNGSSRELCRKTSLTPDALRSSIGRTPTSTFHSRLSRGNAPTPILERLVKARALDLNSPKAYGVPKDVLERAAEAIVYDLVSLDSPVASQACVIDPNSSFENNAFLSRNMIVRSPEEKPSNIDLLKILENSFASPRRNSVNSNTLNEDHFEFEEEKGLLDASSASLIDDLLDFSLNMI